MPYREKSAWISLLAHTLVFGAYFAGLAHVWRWPGHGPLGVMMLIGAVIALAVVAAGLQILAVLTSPHQANAPPDEREHMISLKSERVGSYVLSSLVVCVMATLILGWDGFLAANLLLAAMVVSELAKSLTQIVLFHGNA